jgi:excisionase family DNA binding protein
MQYATLVTAVEEITVREAAQRTGRSPETIRRWIWSGRLPAVKHGNTYYVDVIHLEGVAVEMGVIVHRSTPRDLGTWLAEVDEWKATLAVGQRRQTASDLVIEDRHARR